MTPFPVRLDVRDMYWIGPDGLTGDLCAHGEVVFEIAGAPAWSDAADDLCVSAAAFNLLRTLDADHTPAEPVDEHLFPHCGHLWLPTSADGLVNLTGCPAGLDATVLHRIGSVVVRAPGGASAELPEAVWRRLVGAFADRVEAFYDAAGPKHVPEEDRAWYRAFWSEWRTRRAAAG